MNLRFFILLLGIFGLTVSGRENAKSCESRDVLRPEGSREHRTVRFVGTLNCTLGKVFCATPYYSEGVLGTNDYVGNVSPRCSTNGSLYHDLILILKPGPNHIDFHGEVDIIHNCTVLTNKVHTPYRFEKLRVNARKAFIRYSLDITSMGSETGFHIYREMRREPFSFKTECQVLIQADGKLLEEAEASEFVREDPISFLVLLLNLYFYMFDKLRFILVGSFFLLTFCFYNECRVWMRVVGYFGF